MSGLCSNRATWPSPPRCCLHDFVTRLGHHDIDQLNLTGTLGYMFALSRFHGSLTVVLQTMGVFNLVLLAVCAWFTWGTKINARIENGG